ncbi:MAG: hypothetical protein WC799_22475 [Desulfobacteraceae bacterium]|jgi:hypothetical protein
MEIELIFADEAMKKKIAIGKDTGRGHKKVVEILPQPFESNDNCILEKNTTHRTTPEPIKEHEVKNTRDKAPNSSEPTLGMYPMQNGFKKHILINLKISHKGKKMPEGSWKSKARRPANYEPSKGLCASFIVWQGETRTWSLIQTLFVSGREAGQHFIRIRPPNGLRKT